MMSATARRISYFDLYDQGMTSTEVQVDLAVLGSDHCMTVSKKRLDDSIGGNAAKNFVSNIMSLSQNEIVSNMIASMAANIPAGAKDQDKTCIKWPLLSQNLR